jgi:predicted amidohydrolase YtcJ
MKKLFAALAALLLAPPAIAETHVDNVNGYTLGQDGRMVRFNGLVVDNGGKVKQLLQRGDKPSARADFRIDGRGRTLVPGMIDAHGHVMALGFQATQLDLTETRSLEEAQAKIAAYAAANPSLRWITGWGWNQEKWRLGRFPTAADLDKAVAGKPVWLERIDGHAGWANSAALKAAGVDARTVSPKDGRIERIGNAPSGIFVDAARELVSKSIPPPLPRARDQAFAAAQEILLSYGVTAIADMGTSVDEWQVLRRAGDNGLLNVRVLAYAGGIEPLLNIAGTRPTPWLYDSKLRMVGVKLYSDGALGSRGALLKQDYADFPGHRGLLFNSDATLKNLMSRAAMDGFQVAVHAIGDAANAQLLEAIEELSDTYKGDRRWRVEHAQIVDPADIARFGRNGIIASMQPVHQTSDWRMAEARMGPGRLAGAYAWQSMLQNKVPLAFGSDTPVESPNPFPGLAVAITRVDAEGQPPGGWMPEQRITLNQAFAAFTQGAAFAAFAEDRLGSLERGKMADFVFIDRDIFADATPQQIRETKVLETYVGGRKVWERK